MTMRPLLVCGLDGATFDVLAPLLEAGRMPQLAGLLAEGAGRRLRSTRPPMTFPAWSSFLTGRDPGRHGLFDFTQKVPGAYRVRFTNASDRLGASIFERVGRAGGRVLALGMPATFPPERIPGLLVSGFDAPVSTGSDARAASDPGLYRAVAARVGPWMRPDLEEGGPGAGWHERAVSVLLERVERKTAFALEALRRLRADGAAPDLVCVVFSESDTVQHHFWRDHDPASPRHDPAASALRRDAVARVHERLDAAWGELRAGFHPEATCVVVSDHGFGGASRRVLHLNRYLETCGLLRRRSLAGGVGELARRMRDGALRHLSPRQAQALFRRARPAAARLESAVRFSGIDWGRTAAFSEDVNTQPGVWLNLAGREAEGSVAPAEAERVRREVIEALLDWKLPGGGRVVERALPREEVYEGPCTERAPDVVVELALEGGYAHSLVPTPWSASPAALRTLADDELAGGRGRGMNGTHRPEGILLAAGGLELAPREGPASIVDVAPALLRAMGLAWQDGDAVERPRWSYGRAEEERVRGRLRALGYLE